MCLTVQNPVVSEELRLDSLYVDPDINVLRETTDPGRGLVNVHDRPSPGNVSQCRQLFYTEDYKCRQIYITGDAGLGKSMFCKHLVDLWCKDESESVTITEDMNSEINYFDSDSSDDEYIDNDVITSGDSDSGDSDFLDSVRGDGSTSCGYVSKRFPLHIIKQQKRLARKKKSEKRMYDSSIMSEFKLLFYITLRESPNQYHVVDMINSQILQQDERMQHLEASVLLKKVPCLVIFDGLDEWVCPTDAKVPRFVKPGIPGRNWLNKNNVFVTTTRSWKLDVLQLTSKEVDKHVELAGFNSNSSKAFCYKILKLLKRAERVERTKGKFQAEIQKKGLSKLRNIPVILTQLVCLWFDKQDLGNSQVQLYCSMLEMLLKRADKNLSKHSSTSTPVKARKETLLPECFCNHHHCQAHQHLLVNLCKVAFEALFNPKRERALVFDSSQMEIFGVDQNNVDLCLKSGILSQSKVLGKWSGNEKKLSFLHKKLQEFLAAIFLTYENAESVISHVKHCTTAESFVEMSQVWMFVSGVRPDLAKQLLTYLMTDAVLKDAHLKQNRLTLEDPALALAIQTCLLDCVEESINNDVDLCLPLEDFVIGEQTMSASLESMLTFNKASVKTVYIDTVGMRGRAVERILDQIQGTSCLQKLHWYDPERNNTDIKSLNKILDKNKNNLTCLKLQSPPLASSAAMCSALKHVTALHLFEVKLTHTQKEMLMQSVSQARNITQLCLLQLYCTDDGFQCRPGIDLSDHTELQTLKLSYMYVEHLSAVLHCVKDVELCSVIMTERTLRKFIQELSCTSQALMVYLDHVRVTGDKENPVDLTDLKHKYNCWITECQYNSRINKWTIRFQTKQQQTTMK